MWKGRFPSTKARFCTFDLKHEPVRTQVVMPALDEYDEVISWQGLELRNRQRGPVYQYGRKMQITLLAYMYIARSLTCCMKTFLPSQNATVLNRIRSISKGVAALDACLVFTLANRNWRKYSSAGRRKLHGLPGGSAS